MRYSEPGDLLSAVSEVLRHVVLPDCSSRTARGQLWAAIGILDNLATRTELRPAIRDAEAGLLGSWIALHEPDFDPTQDLGAVRSTCRAMLRDTPGLLDRPGSVEVLLAALRRVADEDQPRQRLTNFYRAFEP